MNISDLKLIKRILQEKLATSNDESMDAHIAIILSEIEGKLVTQPRPTCKVCGKLFNDLDMKVIGSLPHNLCSACFTSNA